MANYSDEKPQLPFAEVWASGDEFKASNPGFVLSIKTADQPYKTGRTRYIVGLHKKSTANPAVAEHLAMKVGPANDRLFVMREPRTPYAPPVATDMKAFTSLD